MALTSDTGQKRQRAVKEDSLFGRFPVSWVYLLPALVFFLGWQLYPIARVAWLSFTDYYLLSDSNNDSWVGLKNSREAFSDPLVWRGLARAAAFTALFLPGMIFLPM